MVTSYKDLLALSDRQAESRKSTVQAAIAQKKFRDRQRRKRQEDREQRDRELETRLRNRYFEVQKQKVEGADEHKAMATEVECREVESQNAEYGPKKGAAQDAAADSGQGPTASSIVLDDFQYTYRNDDRSVLTREERRERRLRADSEKIFQPPRDRQSAGNRKRGRFTADIHTVLTVGAEPPAMTSGHGNIKERLAAMPNTLTRLNLVKRDTRTIDEIVRDRHENKKILAIGSKQGTRSFDDWSTLTCEEDKEKAVVGSSCLTSPSSPQPVSTSAVSAVKHALSPMGTASPGAGRHRSDTAKGSSTLSSRTRAEIWGLFGKRKAEYVARDVHSDSDDDAAMEAGASVVEREEKLSEHFARREDREAEMEVRKCQEEKRRCKAARQAYPGF